MREIPEKLNTSAWKIIHLEILQNIGCYCNNRYIFRRLIEKDTILNYLSFSNKKSNQTIIYNNRFSGLFQTFSEYTETDIFLFKAINNSGEFIDHALRIANTTFYPAVFQALEIHGYFSNRHVSVTVHGLLGFLQEKLSTKNPVFQSMLKKKIMEKPGYFLGEIEKTSRKKLVEKMLLDFSLIIDDYKKQLQYWKFWEL
jgi:hypothetical protein